MNRQLFLPLGSEIEKSNLETVFFTFLLSQSIIFLMSEGGSTVLSKTQNQALYELQKELWGYAEPGFLEHKSAKAMSGFLRREGFPGN